MKKNRKISLDVDALRVDSFPTDGGDGDARGTVHGLQLLSNGCVSGYPTCASACSETDGIRICKSCGPCCYE